MFLSQQEIQDLTGYKVQKKQIQWLRENGIKFLVGCDGKPRVMESHLEAIIGADSTKGTTKRRTEPNESALNKWMGLN